MPGIQRGELVHAIGQNSYLTGEQGQQLIADIGMGMDRRAKDRRGHASHDYISNGNDPR